MTYLRNVWYVAGWERWNLRWIWLGDVGRALGDWAAEEVQKIVGGLLQPFVDEDEPMVEAQQGAMAGRNFWQMKPPLLDVDAPAVRALRVLEQMLAADQQAK